MARPMRPLYERMVALSNQGAREMGFAEILQFQFHRALCRIACDARPLHHCPAHGCKEEGRRFGEMLAMGASRPWPDALEALTGEPAMDPYATLEYFAPLRAWLAEQNRGRACGW